MKIKRNPFVPKFGQNRPLGLKRILNLGCGDDTYGTDFVDNEKTRKYVKQVNIDYQKLPYKDSTFDEVFCYQVMQHLKNPEFALREARRVLKPHGILTVFTINRDFFGWKITKQDQSPWPVIHIFAKEELEELLKKIGFEITYSEYYSAVRYMNWKKYIILMTGLFGKHGNISIQITARKS